VSLKISFLVTTSLVFNHHASTRCSWLSWSQFLYGNPYISSLRGSCSLSTYGSKILPSFIAICTSAQILISQRQTRFLSWSDSGTKFTNSVQHLISYLLGKTNTSSAENLCSRSSMQRFSHQSTVNVLHYSVLVVLVRLRSLLNLRTMKRKGLLVGQYFGYRRLVKQASSKPIWRLEKFYRYPGSQKRRRMSKDLSR
jgi:hypothetical protein